MPISLHYSLIHGIKTPCLTSITIHVFNIIFKFKSIILIVTCIMFTGQGFGSRGLQGGLLEKSPEGAQC